MSASPTPWQPLPPEIETLLREVFEHRIPFNTFLGIKVVRLGVGACELMVPARPELIGDPERPALHGGVVSTLADTAGGLAVFVHDGVPPLPRASTVDLRVDYLRPCQVDLDVHCIADVVRVGNRVGVTRMCIFQEDPSLPVAEARGVYNLSRPKA